MHWPWSATRHALRRVEKELKRLGGAPHAQLDLDDRRADALRHIAKDIQELRLTSDSAAAMDTIVDGHAAGWRQDVERLSRSGRGTLDRLEAQVRSLIARLDGRCSEERVRLGELQGVALNLIDQVGEPEQPRYDPLP
jgi:hypothetical protein